LSQTYISTFKSTFRPKVLALQRLSQTYNKIFGSTFATPVPLV